MTQNLDKLNLEKEIEGISEMIANLEKGANLLKKLKGEGFCSKTDVLEAGFTDVVLVEDEENPMVTDNSTVSRVEDLEIKNVLEIYRPVFIPKLGKPVLPIRGK